MSYQDEREIEVAGEGFVWKMPCEIWSRVVGYFRPVQNWNEGKQQEFSDRVYYDLEKTSRRQRDD